jgi:demethylmenaquinone methyltransferase/2-methoxy-6-polyprenyl-1,4-benzoquinol methylase
MQIAEYYDSVASFWDDDYSEARAARIMSATVSIPHGGACVLDIGCGNGAMFPDLMEAGACEIEGVDISGRMAETALEKYGFDPRIHVEHGDFLEFERPGFDVLTAFNSYQHFPIPRMFLKKATELLRPKGRLTVAFPFGKNRVNILSAIMPAGIARGLLSAEEEAAIWREYFDVDCICDTEGLFLLSGTVSEGKRDESMI